MPASDFALTDSSRLFCGKSAYGKEVEFIDKAKAD
jgi:hypothetical protein